MTDKETKPRRQLTERYDMGVAERFRTFRKKYVSNSMISASDELGISKSNISRIENGLYPVPVKLLKKLVSKYNMNRDWLLDNQGPPIKNEPTRSNLLTDVAALAEMMDAAKNEIKMLKTNLNKLWEIVERQAKTIGEMQNNNGKK